MNSNTFQDVHIHDGKLYKYDMDMTYTKIEKSIMITNLIELIKLFAIKELQQYGIKGLEIIRHDCGSGVNFLQTDNLYADDIAVNIERLLNQVDDKEVMITTVNMLSEQMMDMIITNGFCSSGRVVRLMNVYMFLKEYKK